MRLKLYLKIWLKTTVLSIQTYLAKKGASFMYLLGKLIRFFFFLVLLYTVVGKTKELAGYSLDQMVVFFLVFNLLDMLGQVLYRGVYWFRDKVVSGRFDLTLVKPISPLFQVLTTRTDLLDLPLFLIIFYLLSQQQLRLGWLDLLGFLSLSLASFLIITAVHILIVSVGVITTEIDHTVWIYRDLSKMAKFPVDIYLDSIRAFLTFVVPIALIFTFPAKALMGLLAWRQLAVTVLAALLLFWVSLRFWRFSLTKYSSASS